MAHPKTYEETTIANLPTEILSDVLSYLPRKSQLVQVALVPKRFRDLVEPFLYQSIFLNLTPPAKGGVWNPTPVTWIASSDLSSI